MNSFLKLDIRIGRIINAKPFLKARKPAYQLEVDLGTEIGIKNSSAQLVFGYPDIQSLIGQLCVVVINFPIRKIAGFKSQVLVTGFYADDKRVLLCQPKTDDGTIAEGSRVGVKSDDFVLSESNGGEADISDFINCEFTLNDDRIVQFPGGLLCTQDTNNALVYISTNYEIPTGTILQ
ncbi:hypothetical protein BC833DRAFT_598836 [Globomyces pollinis-pini]|nr:hypothetical protein BC833DRAFT_598836 [Globomyces pollinis-pini]KAJ2996729.1 hypothetical protein HDV02_006231 [Globomyces sp. JEL0801]